MENRHSRTLGRLLVYDISVDAKNKNYYIADGGFSHVYHGVFETRKRVAVKRIQLKFLPDEKKILENEAHLLLELSGHPNMLKYYGTEDNGDFL